MTTPPAQTPRRYRSRGGTTVKPSRQRQFAATLHDRHRNERAEGTAASTTPRPLDGYVRVSRVGSRSGPHFISPEVQEERIRAYARARGLTVGTVFCELDRSGTTFRRELVQQALRRIETGESGGLIVARLDRFARTVLEALEALSRINRAGGEFISVEDGLDSSTPFGRAMMTILLALAELEAGRARDIFRTAQAHAVMRGIHVTGRLPFGYRRDDDGRLTPIPHEAEAIRNAYIRRSLGALPRDIVKDLQASGLFAGRSQKRMIGHVNYLLRNPVYTGEARCGDCINPHAHPAIVNRALWIAAQDPRTQTTFSRNVQTLLGGLVRCGTCGSRMGLRRRAAQSRLYGCHHRSGTCPAPARIPCEQLEQLVTRRFFRWLARLDRQAAQARLAELEAATVAKDDAYGRDVAEPCSQREIAAARRASEDAWLELAQSARLTLVLTLPEASTLRKQWKTLNVSEQRNILAAAIARITVWPLGLGLPAPTTPRVRVEFVGAHAGRSRVSDVLSPLPHQPAVSEAR